jgi:hypothetical protein
MIWLTWRQHRAVLVICTAFVVAFICWMLIVEHDYTSAARAIARSCHSSQIYVPNSRCAGLYNSDTLAWQQGDIMGWVLLLLPLLFGVLLGARLFAGEFERRTVILAFTQNISRTRWTVIRWLLIGLVVLLLSVPLALVSNWWYLHVPTNQSSLGARITPEGFDVTGIVPAAYSLFAFALGAGLGMVLRRTTRAIFGTMALFIAARLLFEHYVRPHLAPSRFFPATEFSNGYTFPINGRFWNVGSGFRVRPGSGYPSTQSYVSHVLSLCGKAPGYDSPGCLTKHGLQNGVYFQVPSHFWALQWGEAGYFVAASAVLLGLTVWSVRRWRA